MKKALVISILAVLVVSCGAGTAATERKPLYWVNPMDPSVRSEVFMKDPMGMDYLPVYEEGGKGEETPEMDQGVISQVTVNQGQASLIGLKTTAVVKEPWFTEVKSVGRINVDENRLVHLSARFSGRVEKLFVTYPGAVVNIGEPLLEIYSPDLVAAQQELLQLSGSGFASQARSKLLFWGLTENQVASIERSRRVLNRVPLLSPVSGTVLSKSVNNGMYLSEGEMLMDLADLDQLWVEADFYEQDVGRIKADSTLELSSTALPGWWQEIPVDFISPAIDPTTRTFRVRGLLENKDGKLKPGMYVDLVVRTSSGDPVLVVPRGAVLDSGDRKLVYVSLGDGRYEGRKVQTGDRNDYLIQILEGLKEGEEVVSTGLFLLDSQAQLADVDYRRN